LPAVEATDEQLSFVRLANIVRADHVADDGGWCQACRNPPSMAPCAAVRMAVRLLPLPAEPELWERVDVLKVLCARDIGKLYDLLQRHGVSQRRIASYTQQSQSEVSEILGGRRVESYNVLARIAEGLGIPRGYMGLAYVDLPGTAEGPA
jgi:hypothetical protein